MSCSSTNNGRGDISETVKSSHLEYFEGEIHYSLDYDNVQVDLNSSQIKEMIGNKVVLIFKNGNHRKDYYFDSTLLSQRFLELAKNKSYSFKPTEDTVLWFDIRKPDSQSKFESLKDTIINGSMCQGLIFHTETPNPWEKGKVFKISSTVYFAKKLAINPDWFKNYLEGNCNELFSLTKSMEYERVDYGPYWSTYMKCDSVIWREVDNSEFSTDFLQEKPMKEL